MAMGMEWGVAMQAAPDTSSVPAETSPGAASDHRSCRPGVRGRAAALGGAAAAMALALSIVAGGFVRDGLLELGSPAVTTVVPVSTAVQLIAGALAAAVAAWIAALLLLGAVSLVPDHRWRAPRRLALRVAPVWVARVATVLVCVCAGGTSAAAAQASAVAAHPMSAPPDEASDLSPDPSEESLQLTPERAPGDDNGDQGDRSVPILEAPEPGWVPLAPPRPAIGEVELLSRGHAPVDAVVVVRGDTLWDIAARHMGPGAAVEAVAAEWPRWYAANRALIGPDPDLILPGQLLQPPATGGER